MEGNVVTDRDLRIIEHLQDSWQLLRDITPEAIAEITRFITGLPDPYKKSAIQIIADRINNTMGLHLLALMATFEANAEQEGVRPKDCQETLQQALPETFRILDGLTTHLSIHSLDDLTILCNIASSLRTLSQTSSADEAENWIDSLPALYYGEVKEENFISKDFLDWTQSSNSQETVQSSIAVSPNGMEQILSQVSL